MFSSDAKLDWPCVVLQVLEWDDWISGDVMNDEEESRALKKIYFLKQIDDYAGTPDLSTIYCLDPKERMVLQCKIEDKSNGSDEPVMRYCL